MKIRNLLAIGGFLLLAAGCAQTDPGITTSVKTQLAADDLVQARRIDVDTRDRVVTLKGEVRTAAEEARALQIARKTDGVKDVVDELSVVPEVSPTTGEMAPDPELTPLMKDAAITATVKTKLLEDPDIKGLQIDVDTKDGTVTLSGTVRKEADKTKALDIARKVEGVTNVTDRLTIERPRY